MAAAALEGGTLDKFIGDAVMVFGDRTRGSEDPGICSRKDSSAFVRMALDMQHRFHACARAGVVQHRASPGSAGVHPVVHGGVFGPPQRRAYTIVGTPLTRQVALSMRRPRSGPHLPKSWLLRAGFARRLPLPLSRKGLRAPVETFQVNLAQSGSPLSLEVDGLALALDPQTADPLEARAVLARAMEALPAELTPARVRTG